MQGWNDLTDAIWINMLMLVTSLPVVTAGAALCAGSTALRKSQRGQGTVTRNYFAAFRENLAKAPQSPIRGSCCRSPHCSFRNSR